MESEYELFSRYITLLFLIYFFISNFFINIISKIFTVISYYLLKLITEVKFISGEIIVGEYKFLIVEACIAPSAYIFIAFIFLTLPIKYRENIKILSSALIVFSIINLIRIIILMYIHALYGIEMFEKFHLVFYEGVSGILTAVIIIYFLKKKHIKKTYPIISDVKLLLKSIKK